jgi:hypothetical protein
MLSADRSEAKIVDTWFSTDDQNTTALNSIPGQSPRQRSPTRVVVRLGGGESSPRPLFSNAATVMISSKKMTVERTKDKRPVEEILEAARLKLVAAMRNGSRFVIMCENAAPDFEGIFNDAALSGGGLQCSFSVFPKQIFEGGGKTTSANGWPDKIYRADQKDANYHRSPTSGSASEDGTIANVHANVVLTTRFAPESFEKFLLNEVGNGLPKPKGWYYPIHVIHGEGVMLEEPFDYSDSHEAAAISIQAGQRAKKSRIQVAELRTSNKVAASSSMPLVINSLGNNTFSQQYL